MGSHSKNIWANRYVELKKIGSGAFGVVYQVRDTKEESDLQRIKALKEITICNMDPDNIAEIAREAKILAGLHHESIIQFYDSFLQDDFYHIVTELCDGKDLNHYITLTKKDGKHLEEARVLNWFIQIIRALQYIHNKKLLHRDLKARNVFLLNNKIKIGDFGIARNLNFTLELVTTFAGTPHYMAPEVLQHHGYGTGADIWSSGILLFEMCALKHPYDAKSIMYLMSKIVEDPVPKLPEEHFSDKLQDVIERILIKNPENRPTAKEVLDFPYIKKAIKDPWMDIASEPDLSETLVNNENVDFTVMDYTVRRIDPSEDDTLTPIQKLRLKKKKKAEKEAEKLKEIGKEIYRDNTQTKMMIKNDRNSSSLQFANRDRQTNPITKPPTPEAEFKPSKSLEFKSSNQNDEDSEFNISPEIDLNRTFNIADYYPNKTPFYKTVDIDNCPERNNKDALYNTAWNFDAEEDNLKCQPKYFDPNDIPEEEKNALDDYSDDFEEVESEADQPEQTNNEEDNNWQSIRFQDDENLDLYGAKAKNLKIQNMKKKCIELVGEQLITECLEIFGKSKKSPDQKTTDIRMLCKNDEAAFLIEQIHFLSDPSLQIY